MSRHEGFGRQRTDTRQPHVPWFLILGWRLRDDPDDSKSDETRFGLLQLMIWTAAVGVVLAICRLVLPGEGWREISIEWQQVLIYGIASLYPVIIAVPSVWFCLRNKGNIALRLLALGAISLGAAFVEATLVISVMSVATSVAPPNDIWTRILPISLAVNFGQAAALVCTLLVIRLWGYRLVGRQPRNNASSPAVVEPDAIV